jgi:hypothetical protein
MTILDHIYEARSRRSAKSPAKPRMQPQTSPIPADITVTALKAAIGKIRSEMPEIVIETPSPPEETTAANHEKIEQLKARVASSGELSRRKLKK